VCSDTGGTFAADLTLSVRLILAPVTADVNAPPPDSSSTVTELLRQCRGGRRDAVDRVFPLIYDELQRIARGQLKRERADHTLSTTALVHEAYIRLVDVTRMDWRDRVHFLSMAARAMRRILIDHARRRRAERRGGGAQPVTLDEAMAIVDVKPEALVSLDDALKRLAALNPRLVRVVECRYFGGMTEDETAQALEVTSRTVRRDWIKARGWLRQALESSG
jgi:RNA polymerase sigma factor (TIGR02999 family)